MHGNPTHLQSGLGVGGRMWEKEQETELFPVGSGIRGYCHLRAIIDGHKLN